MLGTGSHIVTVHPRRSRRLCVYKPLCSIYMTGKLSRKVPKSAYVLLPIFCVWTCVNIYLGLSYKYGSPLGPQKTKFLIDEADKTKS